MRLALIGDVHLFSLRLWPWDMLSKRLLGQTNLWLNRRNRFRMDGLPGLVQRIDQVRPDRLIGTGDLTTTALGREFSMVQSALGPTLDRYDGFVVPGNHDRYTWTAAWTDRWARGLGRHTASRWPHRVDLGDGLGLLGLDPTRPTFGTASGKVGRKQLAQLEKILADPKVDRWIVCGHYPIGVPEGHAPESWQHRLRDMDALVRVLSEANRPILYCHGHEHVPWCYRHPKAPQVTVVNAGAPLMVDMPHWPHGQGFWLIDTEATSSDNVSDRWHLWHQAEDAQGQWTGVEIQMPEEPGVSPKLI